MLTLSTFFDMLMSALLTQLALQKKKLSTAKYYC